VDSKTYMAPPVRRPETLAIKGWSRCLTTSLKRLSSGNVSAQEKNYSPVVEHGQYGCEHIKALTLASGSVRL
jgi:hypothetical protein